MSEKKSVGTVFFNGIIPENPTFRLVLGTCPTLAVTTSAINGLGMGAAATFVLLGSNTVAALAAIVVGVIVYGLMIVKTKTILRDEMMEISFGRKLAQICDRLHLW